jgi:hypothetical protein
VTTAEEPIEIRGAVLLDRQDHLIAAATVQRTSE